MAPGLGLALPDVPLLVPGGSGAPRSLALNGSSQYLTATGKTGINQQKFTFATFYKSSASSLAAFVDFNNGTASNSCLMALQATQPRILLQCETAGTIVLLLPTANNSAVKDGNWHHVVFSVDTTQAVASNRAHIYFDAVEASYNSPTYPTQNTDLSNNFASTFSLGSIVFGGAVADYFSGKLAQTYYIDGQALGPSAFVTGSGAGTTLPKAYSGSYTGAFDFFLPYGNSGSLGADSSGEGNNWAPQGAPTQSTDYP